MRSYKSLQGALLLMVGALFAGAALAEDEPAVIGKKIYDRAFGRGCGTCHDGAAPNLFESVNKLSKEDFTAVLVNGRNAMPKAMDQIMAMPVAKTLTQDHVVEALIAYLKAGKK